MNEGQLKNFKIVNTFLGFRNKRDVVKEGPGVAVSGSQNIVIIDGEKIGVRPGFSYIGGRSTDRYGIQGGGSWKTSTGTEIMWRSYYDSDTAEGFIEILVEGVWRTLLDGLTLAKFRDTTWWSTTEVLDLLILVCGDSNQYAWSGGVATYASLSATTITLSGGGTWAESRFLVAGTREFRIQDTLGVWHTVGYTGGESTDTLTGLTVDLTSFTFTVGTPVLQEVRVTSDKPSATRSNDFVTTYLNYLFVFDEENRTVQMSKSTDYTDFTSPASPRLPGEAAVFTLDDVPTGAITQPDGSALYISTKNQWYQIVFTPSADLTKEQVTILPLKTSPLEGATNSLAVRNMKNQVLYVSGEPTIDTLGRVESIDTPQSTPFSDQIKKTLDASGPDRASVQYYKNANYICLSEFNTDISNNRMLVRNLSGGYWETPWTIPGSVVFEYAGELFVHDPATRNTYQLNDDSYSDGKNGDVLGAPISARWYSSHENYGLPFNHKKFNKMWIDGYIRINTTLRVYLIYDFESEPKYFDIIGTNEAIIIDGSGLGGGLGTYNLGQRNLGSRGQTLSASGLKRFRGFIDLPERPFYELQTSFQSTGVGYRWEVVEFGFNINAVEATDNNLKIN